MKKYAFATFLIVSFLAFLSPPTMHAGFRARSLAETVHQQAAPRLSAGNSHTCQTLNDGTIRCWGLNNAGQLGDGSNTDRLTPVGVLSVLTKSFNTLPFTNAIAVAGGANHNCALRASGTVLC